MLITKNIAYNIKNVYFTHILMFGVPCHLMDFTILYHKSIDLF